MLEHGRLGKDELVSVIPTQFAGSRAVRVREELREELVETNTRLAEIMERYRDPERSLEEKIRLNIRRNELESYAAGLRYAMGGPSSETRGRTGV